MAVEDKKLILYHSTSGTSVNNSSEEGKRPQGILQSKYKETNIAYKISTSLYVVDI